MCHSTNPLKNPHQLFLFQSEPFLRAYQAKGRVLKKCTVYNHNNLIPKISALRNWLHFLSIFGDYPIYINTTTLSFRESRNCFGVVKNFLPFWRKELNLCIRRESW